MYTTEQAAAIAKAELEARMRPDDFTAYEALGDAYFGVERYDEALRAYQNALVLNPKAGSLYDGIGHTHYRTGSLDAAKAAYEQGISADPRYEGNYYGLSLLYATKLGRYDQAVEAVERGLAANPGSSFLKATLGSTYARKGEIEKGIQILEQVAREHPNHAYTFGWLGLLYLNQRRFAEAQSALRHENELNESESSHRLLGYIALLNGRMEDAIAELERSVALEPDDYEARAALAHVYRLTGSREEGDRQYRQAKEQAEQDNEYGQACFHAVSGNVEEALNLLEIAIQKDQVQPGWARIDPEFVFLQDQARYQALVE